MAKKERTRSTGNAQVSDPATDGKAATKAKGSTKSAAKAAAQTTADSGRSIIGAKYRDKYRKGDKDWVGQIVDAFARGVEKKEIRKGDEVTVKEVQGKVDTDKLFTLARANSIDVDHLEAQNGSPNFQGRMYMTVNNLLRGAASKRHGLFVPNAKGKTEWREAPKDFLEARKAPATPSHTPKGEKIKAPAPAAAAAAA